MRVALAYTAILIVFVLPCAALTIPLTSSEHCRCRSAAAGVADAAGDLSVCLQGGKACSTGLCSTCKNCHVTSWAPSSRCRNLVAQPVFAANWRYGDRLRQQAFSWELCCGTHWRLSMQHRSELSVSPVMFQLILPLPSLAPSVPCVWCLVLQLLQP